MRIAKEIVNNIESSHRATLGFGESDHLRDIAIVAAKLEPVKVALQEMCDHSGLMGYLEMHHPALRCVAEEALAKLSEEA